MISKEVCVKIFILIYLLLIIVNKKVSIKIFILFYFLLIGKLYFSVFKSTQSEEKLSNEEFWGFCRQGKIDQDKLDKKFEKDIFNFKAIYDFNKKYVRRQCAGPVARSHDNIGLSCYEYNASYHTFGKDFEENIDKYIDFGYIAPDVSDELVKVRMISLDSFMVKIDRNYGKDFIPPGYLANFGEIGKP